ncbi:RodZ domain-containing protein [Asaia prunellae]|uniref:RodZ domain-containing protein n=1 Tax=Asaia prunellae TaxID=610245 RepID=UPI00068694AB|nr:RodZ domain-containing protein [Asaia prunellae]
MSPASAGVTGAGNGATSPSLAQPDQAALSPPAVTPQPETAQSSLPITTRPEPPGANSTATETPPVSPAAANMIVLHAAADAWVSIRDKTGAIVLSRVLKAGETWQGAEDAGPYRMTLGNAGGLSLSAGDVTTAALGRVGAVRRGLVVTAEAIRNGQLGQETGAAGTAMPAAAPAPNRGVVSPDTGSGQNASPTLKKPPIVPKMTTTGHESETDRLNARQLEQTAQPR